MNILNYHNFIQHNLLAKKPNMNAFEYFGVKGFEVLEVLYDLGQKL